VRIGYLDLVGGVSGDMFVGALLDAGWPEAEFRDAVGWLGDEIRELRVETRIHLGLRGLGIVVTPAAPAGHRTLGEVLERIAGAPLDPAVARTAGAVFRRLAAAEGRAHGVDLEQVRFHEVGAVDALVDVVGACAGVRALGIARLHVSPVPLGPGVLPGAHGPLPLPAPATAYLLEGAPVRWTQTEGERCTPTGAALVQELGVWSPAPPMTLLKVGCGAGTRSHPEVPNLTRLFLGEAAGEAPQPGALDLAGEAPLWGWGPGTPGVWGRVVVLGTQIDDATPEEVAWLVERLRSGAALEVLVNPVQMKKDRTGFELTVIARPADEEPLVATMLELSPTLGVRRRLEWRRELVRSTARVATPYGAIEVKLARRAGGWTAEPEYESCRWAADAAGVPLRAVWRAAVGAIEAGRATPPPDPC
jgi:pyridinium-3,5-bisthiocarboxylic acid mononucleotide nickel chelatase